MASIRRVANRRTTGSGWLGNASTGQSALVLRRRLRTALTRALLQWFCGRLGAGMAAPGLLTELGPRCGRSRPPLGGDITYTAEWRVPSKGVTTPVQMTYKPPYPSFMPLARQ